LKPAEPDVLLSRLKKVIRLKRLELDLKASEERYRNLFENIGDGAFQIDPNGLLTNINRAGARILGYNEPIELVNERKIWSFFASPEECEKIKVMVLRDGEITQRLTRYRGCYGALGWLETTLRCRIVDGLIVGFEGIFRDVTERIRYQEMLESLHSLWSDLTEVETIDDISDLTLEFLNAIIDVNTGCFRVLEGNQLSFTGEGIGWNERRKEALMGSSISARAARTGRLQIVSDTREELDLVPVTSWDEEILSQMAVPVKINGNVIAVIEIGSVNPIAYADEDQKLLEVITEQVALAMNRLIQHKLSKRSDLRLGDFL
jgi:PAS domain S-box-containing protein